MEIRNEELYNILTELHYVPKEDKEILRVAESDDSLYVYLIGRSILTKDLIGQAIAEHLDLPYADLNTQIPAKDDILKVPEKVAKKYRAVFFKESDDEIFVATDSPKAKGLKPALKKVLKKKKLALHYSLPEDIDTILLVYRKPLKERFKRLLKRESIGATELLDEIFQDALIYHASDIHLEPTHNNLTIRFRIDGVMHVAGTLPLEQYETIINRIKVQAHLRIDQHRVAQDGALQYSSGSFKVDMRVSIVPTLEGEKIVIRLLSRYIEDFVFQNLGLDQRGTRLIQEAGKKPFGMIMVSGPTGSGKTTTLYALIKTLNDETVNITTIEDPVEYRISGVNQIQVNTGSGLTFSSGLRSIVRQDPDIILVGEIRDTETSEIAVNAALTGHLLFSTFHANDAATSIPRLLDMDVEPFLLASTLELVISQRLVRKLCEQCRYSYQITKEDIEGYPQSLHAMIDPETTLYNGGGCSTCNHTGYQGRIGIFEFIEITPDLKDLILKNPSSDEIWNIARKHGAQTLFEDGLDKVMTGITSLDELLRVAEPPYAEKKKTKKKKRRS